MLFFLLNLLYFCFFLLNEYRYRKQPEEMEDQEITHHQLGYEQEDSQTSVKPSRYTTRWKVS